MKLLIPIVTGVFLFTACNPAKKSDQALDSAVTKNGPTAVAVQLTEQQKAEGWKLLFDGQTMKGWRTFKNKENNSWEVQAGTLHCKPVQENGENKRSDLITTDQYENYELALEWKISAKGNSGIIYRATEDFDQPYLSGPEYQVLDDNGYPDKIEDWQKTGANYAMNPPAGSTPKPAGEWNSTKIIVKGNHVEHWLNGVKVVEYEMGSDDWKKRKAKGKWNDAKGYGTAKKGHIDLQDHGNEAWYRNIMIKEV